MHICTYIYIYIYICIIHTEANEHCQVELFCLFLHISDAPKILREIVELSTGRTKLIKLYNDNTIHNNTKNKKKKKKRNNHYKY